MLRKLSRVLKLQKKRININLKLHSKKHGNHQAIQFQTSELIMILKKPKRALLPLKKNWKATSTLHSKNQQATQLTIKYQTLELIATFYKPTLHLKLLKKNTSTNFTVRVSFNWNLNQIQFADLEDATNTLTQKNQEDIQSTTQSQTLEQMMTSIPQKKVLILPKKCITISG